MSSTNPTAPQPERGEGEVAAPSATPSSSPAEGESRQKPTASPTTGDASPVAATAENAEPAPRTTRLLKDVEAEENRYIYETLYKSLEDETDTNIRDELTVGDTVRQAREAKQEFLKATSLPIKEKMKGCAALMRNLSEERNKKVAYVFVVYSVLILTLPLIMLMLGIHVLAPRWKVDATYCGGGLAVGTALVLVVSYVVYAVREDIADFKRTAEQEAEEKKKK
ncbi:hypothetical protein ABB37_00657 [Leptomonas pyrrhocoris]|uniref:Uncharacterized protein n=1 Tax=Leptomonas pyrrhocoris TaxID=157538 RepID=A0A0N0E0J2_LEPPY|nr:hypothetical protein ABB37_00657 [Leptomonas pyrrhocoris]KPA86511.1 hypothetical protein ABB37_00657 [Leptomonas pyrrhocoris]|eukprot:XP_015664950.1 hypothetical protein ABB37_00657 [Leptomonas pyrrhocoris]